MRTYVFDHGDSTDAGVGTGMGPLADSESHTVQPNDPHATHPSHSSSAFSSFFSNSSNHLFPGLFVTQAERVITVTTRMKNTATCIVIYIVLMILNIFLMSWELAGRGYNPGIIILECIINIFIVSEVTIGVYGLGREYFHSWMNIVDFVLSLGCVAFFCFIVITQTQEQANYMSGVDAVLLAVRFLFQLTRLSVLMYRSRKIALMQAQEEVDFNAISLEACIDDEASLRRARGRSPSDEIDGLGLGLGLNASSLTDIDGAGRSGNDGLRRSGENEPPTTSYIHLKPSIYLELQTARAFAEKEKDLSIPPPASGASSSSTTSTSNTSLTPAKPSHPSSAVSSSSTLNTPLCHPQPSLQVSRGSPNVPILTPPLTPEPFEVTPPISRTTEEERSYNSLTNSTSISSSFPSSSSSLSRPTSLGRTPLHPVLAHDSVDLLLDDEEDVMHDQLNVFGQNLSYVLEAEKFEAERDHLHEAFHSSHPHDRHLHEEERRGLI